MRIEKIGRNNSEAQFKFGALPFIFATLITTLAGFLDAIGFTHLSGLYVSFMSGNSTGFGLAIARGNEHVIVPAAFVISSFVLGAFLGTLVGDSVSSRKVTAILSAEVCLLVLSVILTTYVNAYPALLPVCVAMGMQNAVHRNIGGADVGKSFVTGFLFGLGESLAHVVRGRSNQTQWLVYGTSWVAFVSGVVGGSVTLTRLGFTNALLVGCGAMIGLAMCSLIYEKRGRLHDAHQS
jgi:oxalate decarboxylase